MNYIMPSWRGECVYETGLDRTVYFKGEREMYFQGQIHLKILMWKYDCDAFCNEINFILFNTFNASFSCTAFEQKTI